MAKYIPLEPLLAEIERLKTIQVSIFSKGETQESCYDSLTCISVYNEILSFINTLEMKEVDKQNERMIECPYRQVVCTMYEDRILECDGACSWVVDYPKLKELKTQKGEKV